MKQFYLWQHICLLSTLKKTVLTATFLTILILTSCQKPEQEISGEKAETAGHGLMINALPNDISADDITSGKCVNLGGNPGWPANNNIDGISGTKLQDIKNAGFKWIRMSIKWEEVDNHDAGQPCNYSFNNHFQNAAGDKTPNASYEEWIDAAKAGQSPVGIIFTLTGGHRAHTTPITEGGVVTGFTPPITSAQRLKFKEFSDASVNWAKVTNGYSKIMFEIWNEPNSPHYWDNGVNCDKDDVACLTALSQLMAEQYTELVRAIVPDMKTAGASVIGPALAPNHDQTNDWIGRIKAYTTNKPLWKFDAITIHFYQKEVDQSPEKVIETIYRWRNGSDGFGNAISPDVPFISGEWGYPTGDVNGSAPNQIEPVSLNVQAAYLVRAHLLLAGEGVMTHNYFQWDHPDGEVNNGMRFYEIIGKPAEFAATRFSATLENYKIVEKSWISGATAPSGSYWIKLLKQPNNNNPVYVFWNRASSGPSQITLSNLAPGNWKRLSSISSTDTGTVITVPSNGTYTGLISTTPVYLIKQ
ncbi:cellulase family glycosylhydrolase [Pedobacter heparinus]|uniref:cellulase family glycosylhydrolase n=1 Tax=Pedobacter heparinus TaxID=984 RepID=UPI00293063C6|nr:cellulase family glycosylhydrolase [Pedobacter heparinus]